ncbi:MAG: tRNA (adenosine(37)-N6)-threonylcarbamoyltransferase complex transferase subunit TsaD [Sphingobacteriia bacterium 24-36-13]|jgi:N6-L-threonylcarbamoyladenine synthase|uniref:tRNA (adenosine(37)-N6)-threonylcarbamoyltransferase complex transferase subunit TsaD n=1 Tax=Sediminibacterium sp. TaxID=1917865 RepID=UPI000BD4F880|nr:tRNA (adenosine(37)-N6)-threonylcarbamoyltransferase complex transferase subunit TsaD [Sediminibacterium sp.]OYY11448.1 MAG: tRNA (adenosine(37)-N6)-threonylcarbamoyltransferase complex transferase subunit TsaD [Sphingobacteriia bacterium 35-36-14]OYZ55502.1 MAG: tRNA (adenosine(37)-N6)-threonylcarbamoyltransferase complex transferase subunit TsaD [Sphingobacteriia bacterium 24-36-13]OZA66042.1 MAG: tRNA (adenosine(37)-N6)-threonylcarbamoyltransferase complex transferase subunit TsaD [Sphingo
MSVTILAIESSCDETAAAVCKDGMILSNIIASQSVHEKYGGVVPELASRAHMQNIVPVVDQAIKNAGITLTDLNAIAFTQAPGLIGSLLVGTQFAKSLSLSLGVPLIGVHHMQAHVLANLIPDEKPSFPFLCLTVSGGHTQIVLAKSALELEVIGETIDDAAGEAFDKTAKLLGLPYPGGPLIDQYAQLGDPLKFKFAEPQIPELNFSFSGLKTSVLYFLQKQTPEFILENRNDLCASIQYTIVQILLKKLVKAVNQTNVKQVCIAGGVSANSGLRTGLISLGQKKGWQVFIPDFSFCTDNAAMIAITGFHKYLSNQFVPLSVNPSARAEW